MNKDVKSTTLYTSPAAFSGNIEITVIMQNDGALTELTTLAEVCIRR